MYGMGWVNGREGATSPQAVAPLACPLTTASWLPLGDSALCLTARLRCFCATPTLQLLRAKEDASSSRTEAARARAEAEFERERNSRLIQSLEMQASGAALRGQRPALSALVLSTAPYWASVFATCRHAVGCPREFLAWVESILSEPSSWPECLFLPRLTSTSHLRAIQPYFCTPRCCCSASSWRA
jgi:hypothetical protein